MPPPGDTSDLLGQFLTTEDAAASDSLLSRIVGELAEPVVSKVVAARIAGPGAEDVRHDVLADLIGRLREWKDSGGGSDVRDFQSYAAVSARNGCDEYYRQLFPQRYRLQKRLRYLLTKDRRFALWEAFGGQLMSGRSEWRPFPRPRPPGLGEFTWESSRQAANLVDGIFGEAGAPVPFDDLIDRVARHWGIADHAEPAREEPVAAGSIQTTMENRGWLKRLWSEVSELPARQRSALLLNLRDDHGGSALVLLPITGVATMRDIAGALELAAEDLARIWRELPWDDQRIATLLNLTRQQVANLRKSARERLARRLR
jgi:hypothetical protein